MSKALTFLLAALLLGIAGCTSNAPSTPNPYGDGYTTANGFGHRHPLPTVQNQPAPMVVPDEPTPAQQAHVIAPPPNTHPRLGTQGLPGGAYSRVKLKLLVVAATSDEPEVAALQSFLPQIGVPYDLLIASQTQLTADMLESEPGLGNYNGVIVTNTGLPYIPAGGSGFVSALDDSEWSLLRQYEADYRVREVQYSGFPDGQTLSWITNIADANADTISLTADGLNIFPYLKSTAQIPLENSYTYYSTLSPSAPNAKPLLTTPRGIVAATRSWPDGRESLVMSTAHNYYLTHSSVLTYGLVRWVSRGIFLGEKKMYYSAHVDDLFLPNELWNVNTNANYVNPVVEWRMRPTDMQRLVDWQNSLHTTFSAFSGFKFEWFFNGFGFDFNAPSNCLPPNNANDPLSAAAKCQKSNFYWGNHTFSHVFVTNLKNNAAGWTTPPGAPQVDPDSYTLARLTAELADNINIANVSPTGLQLSSSEFDTGALVTGSHSGIGYYDYSVTDNIGGPPDIPSPAQNEGKSRTNPNLITAMNASGIHYLGSNTSAPTTSPNCISVAANPASDCNQNNPSPNAGQYLVGPALPANDILLIPRFPVNIFYNVDTIAREVDEYNFIFKAFWTANGHPADLTWAEILNLETNTALNHIVSGSVNPHYFHQADFHFDDGDTGTASLLTIFTQELARKYSLMFTLPVLTLKMSDLGDRMRTRMAYDASGAQGIWDRTTGTVTLSAATNAAIPVTNPTLGDVYGPDRVTTATSGQTITVGAGI